MVMYRQDIMLGLLQLNVSIRPRLGSPQRPSSLLTASLRPLGLRPTVMPNSMHCTTGSSVRKATILQAAKSTVSQ